MAAGAAMPEMGMPKEKSAKKDRQYYELRVYLLKNEVQQHLVEDYFEHAFIPAIGRMGNNRTGVFTELKPQGQTRLFALISYSSWDDIAATADRLAKDSDYLAAADAYLNAPATAPAYDRIESSLLKAFVHMPKMQAPGKKERIFELRRYENPTEAASKKKLEMFNDAGEIDIFKRLGFDPVFFGETLVGPLRPNLTYMVTFDNMADHDAHWKAFGSDPEWKKISSMPDYADAKLISRITPTFLVPEAFSQV